MIQLPFSSLITRLQPWDLPLVAASTPGARDASSPRVVDSMVSHCALLPTKRPLVPPGVGIGRPGLFTRVSGAQMAAAAVRGARIKGQKRVPPTTSMLAGCRRPGAAPRPAPAVRAPNGKCRTCGASRILPPPRFYLMHTRAAATPTHAAHRHNTHSTGRKHAQARERRRRWRGERRVSAARRPQTDAI